LVTPSPILNLTNLLGINLKLIFMKNLELTQMEMLHGGGCSASQERTLAIVGSIATVAGFFGPIGAIIAGPTALGVAVGSLWCAYN
jgi:hypothetical protein